MYCIVADLGSIFVWQTNTRNIKHNKMETQREMDSKAGTRKNEISVTLKKTISKIASSLLIAMAGFSMMSFDLQDDSIHYADTNVNTNTVLASTNDCCAAEVVTPVIGPKKGLISFTNSKAEMEKADAEHVRNFAAEEHERKIWGTSLSAIRATADKEAVYNFTTNMLYPEANVAAAADAQVIRLFGEDLLQLAAKLAITNADAEAQDNFWKENCTINVQLSAKSADEGMVKMFADSLMSYITYPSPTTIAGADAEVVGNYEASLKTATIAIK